MARYGASIDLDNARFTAILVCRACTDPTVVVGWTGPDENYDGPKRRIVPWYQPLFFEPAPECISLDQVPKDVASHIVRATSAYWSDPAAAGNAVRTAVERMMDERQVPSTFVDRKGKTRRSDLARRIREFGATGVPQSLVDALQATRVIGNAGTHEALDHEDVIEALELVEVIFIAVYRPAESIEKRVARILQTNKPNSKS